MHLTCTIESAMGCKNEESSMCLTIESPMRLRNKESSMRLTRKRPMGLRSKDNWSAMELRISLAGTVIYILIWTIPLLGSTDCRTTHSISLLIDSAEHGRNAKKWSKEKIN